MIVGEPQLQQHTGLPARVAVYIDGFNLFYGLRDKGWRRYYWLDVRTLAGRLLRPGQSLAFVRYFTARVLSAPDDPDKPNRQNTYLEALATLPNLSIHYGYFMPRRGGGYEEKMTDVNIAVELLCDAHADAFDTAILVSGDSDLTSALLAVRERYGKRVVVAFPPARRSAVLREAARASIAVERSALRDSQLPDRVTGVAGISVERPTEWS